MTKRLSIAAAIAGARAETGPLRRCGHEQWRWAYLQENGQWAQSQLNSWRVARRDRAAHVAERALQKLLTSRGFRDYEVRYQAARACCGIDAGCTVRETVADLSDYVPL